MVAVIFIERMRGEDTSGAAGLYMFGGVTFVLVTLSLWLIGRRTPLRPWVLVLVALPMSAVVFFMLMMLFFVIIMAVGLAGGFS